MMFLERVVDLRRGEGATVARAAFALFLILAAHTALETARDILLLTRFPARDLGAVYIVMSFGVFVAAMSAWVSARIGARRPLVAALVVVAGALVLLFALPLASPEVLALNLVSWIVGAVIVPLYWSVLADVFTVAEGRRLLGAIGAASTVGATVGSGLAAAVVGVLPVHSLLPIAAGIALAAILVIPRAPSANSSVRVNGRSEAPRGKSEPFLRHIAVLVAASTAAVVLIDFTFKWTLTRTLAGRDIAMFVARFYAVTSAASFVAQLVLSRTIVGRLGVAWAIVVVPFTMAASVAALAASGAMAAVLLLKALDVALRHSLHRMTMELVYLPLNAALRARAKPLIDGALVRVVQAVAGAGLFAASVDGRLTPRLLAGSAVTLASTWLTISITLRKPYVALLRRTISRGALDSAGTGLETSVPRASVARRSSLRARGLPQ